MAAEGTAPVWLDLDGLAVWSSLQEFATRGIVINRFAKTSRGRR